MSFDVGRKMLRRLRQAEQISIDGLRVDCSAVWNEEFYNCRFGASLISQ